MLYGCVSVDTVLPQFATKLAASASFFAIVLACFRQAITQMA